ncbi:MAG: SnoaL-like domain-containing protein [Proteobacteria bacterium]|nr:hypothetical protein [Pseudomonadota bacterium]NOG59555.1 SnoaL-like domain-containing protein [Pseudomonadota bacterium]
MKHIIKQFVFIITMLFVFGIPQLNAETIVSLKKDDKTYQHILQLTKDYYKAWSYKKEDAQYDQPGKYYSKAAGLQFWDPLPPLGGHRGWQEYQHVIEDVWLPNGIDAAAILFSHDDSFHAWRHGDVIWTSANCLVRAEYKDGSNATIPCRGSQVWQRQNDHWLVVHEHFSTPIVPDGKLFQGQRDPKQSLKVNKAFTERARAVAAQWQKGPIANIAKRLDGFYYKQDIHLYMPWPPHDGYTDWDSFDDASTEYLSLFANTIKLTVNDDLEATQHGDIAWTTATVTQEIEQDNGNTLLVNGRQTLIWVIQDNQWLIAHEHLSFPLLPKEK